jgi:hypothetical protein
MALAGPAIGTSVLGVGLAAGGTFAALERTTSRGQGRELCHESASDANTV